MVEGLEHSREHLLGYALALVLDGDLHPVAGAVRRHLYEAGRGRELDRVVEQAGEHLAEPGRVGEAERQAFLDLDAHQRPRVRARRGGAPQDRVDLGRAQLHRQLAPLDGGDVEEVGDQQLEAVGRPLDALPDLGDGVSGEVAGARRERLGEPGDGGQGCAQLVGDHRDEVALHLLRLLQPEARFALLVEEQRVLYGGRHNRQHREDASLHLDRERVDPQGVDLNDADRLAVDDQGCGEVAADAGS